MSSLDVDLLGVLTGQWWEVSRIYDLTITQHKISNYNAIFKYYYCNYDHELENLSQNILTHSFFDNKLTHTTWPYQKKTI